MKTSGAFVARLGHAIAPMALWKQWWHRPQGVRVQRLLFQIHLWLGLALALYVVMLSITGSILVYRIELTRLLDVQAPAYDPTATPLSSEELRIAVLRAFPDHRVVEVDTSFTRRRPIARVRIERDGEHRRRAFNPYTGEDLGDIYPLGVRAVFWVVDLHDDLLLQRHRRWINGIGSIFVTVLTVTGIVVWWPGIGSWRRALTVKWRAQWPRLNWDLHSAFGFWLFLLILNWSVTGIYLAFPIAFTRVLDFISPPDGVHGLRASDVALDWLIRMHFGRWRNPYFKALWFAVGLVPTLLTVTGVVMWWNRVARHAMKNYAPSERSRRARVRAMLMRA